MSAAAGRRALVAADALRWDRPIGGARGEDRVEPRGGRHDEVDARPRGPGRARRARAAMLGPPGIVSAPKRWTRDGQVEHVRRRRQRGARPHAASARCGGGVGARRASSRSSAARGSSSSPASQPSATSGRHRNSWSNRSAAARATVKAPTSSSAPRSRRERAVAPGGEEQRERRDGHRADGPRVVAATPPVSSRSKRSPTRRNSTFAQMPSLGSPAPSVAREPRLEPPPDAGRRDDDELGLEDRPRPSASAPGRGPSASAARSVPTRIESPWPPLGPIALATVPERGVTAVYEVRARWKRMKTSVKS